MTLVNVIVEKWSENTIYSSVTKYCQEDYDYSPEMQFNKHI